MSDKPDFVPTPQDFFGWVGRMMNIQSQTLAAGMPQTPPNLADPLEFWKTMMERNEQLWSTFTRQITASPEFAQTMGRTASNTAAYRSMVQKTAKAYLESADIPSREDIIRMAKQIVALDAKVDIVEELLEDNLTQLPLLLEKTLASVEKLNARLEKLESSLSELTEVKQRLAALEAQTTKPENIPAIAPVAKTPPTRRPRPKKVTG